MDWARDGADWPHRENSWFVRIGGVAWHVQRMGAGPPLLLLHGTGAATHSWRDLMPRLAERFSVLAPDLPGHAFTSAQSARATSLPGMARALRELLDGLGFEPAIVAGHSAGAALLARMALDGALPSARVLVALNGAFLPLGGLLRVMSPVAKLLAATPAVPQMIALRARGASAVERLIAGTGSSIDARGAELYARLMRDPGHVAGVLSMMANWNLAALPRQLDRLPMPLLLAVGTHDRTVPPEQALRIAARVPGARIVELPGLGHLAQEEDPAQVAGVILRAAREHGVLGHAHGHGHGQGQGQGHGHGAPVGRPLARTCEANAAAP